MTDSGWKKVLNTTARMFLLICRVVWKDGLKPTGRTLAVTWKEFCADNCFPRSAALSYTTLLSLIPLLAVSFSLYSSFGQFENNMDDVRNFLFKQINPGSVEALDDFYDTLMASSEKATAVGILGMVALVLSAWAILNAIEKAFNHIWGVKRERPLMRKFVSYTAFIFWFPILIALSIFLTGFLQNYFFGEKVIETSWNYRFYELSLPFILTWGAFYFAYSAIPNRTIPWKSALVGSFVASLLWELAKVGFNYYVTEVSSFQKLYSALGTVPLFLLWVYYSWLIVLFGAELAFAMAHPQGNPARVGRGSGHVAYYGLRIMQQVGQRFKAGAGPVDADQLAKQFALDNVEVEGFLSRLADLGVLIGVGDEPIQYTLSRDPRTLSIQAIVSAAEGDTFTIPATESGSHAKQVESLLADARLERESVLSKTMLDELLGEE